MMEDVLSRLREFIEEEVRSGSMDFGCITPLYIYRMLVGAVSMKEISTAMDEIKKNHGPGGQILFYVITKSAIINS